MNCSQFMPPINVFSVKLSNFARAGTAGVLILADEDLIGTKLKDLPLHPTYPLRT
jgi:hypothetical protein